jgi:hypothetical protein
MASETLNEPDNTPLKQEDSVHLGRVALVFIGFAILYLATAYYFDSDVQRNSDTVATGQLFGPIQTKNKNTVVEIELVNPGVNNSWKYVEATVLDDQKNVVSSFSSNFHHASGRDHEGPWNESEKRSGVKVALPKPGKYFLKFAVRGGETYDRTGKDLTNNTRITVIVTHKNGTPVFYSYFGIALLIIGVILNEIRNQTIISVISKLDY